MDGERAGRADEAVLARLDAIERALTDLADRARAQPPPVPPPAAPRPFPPPRFPACLPLSPGPPVRPLAATPPGTIRAVAIVPVVGILP